MKKTISILAIVALISSCTNKKPLAPTPTPVQSSYFYNLKIDASSNHSNNIIYSSIRVGSDDDYTVRPTHTFNNTFHLDTMIQGDGVNIINYALVCADTNNLITVSIIGNGINFTATGHEIFKP